MTGLTELRLESRGVTDKCLEQLQHMPKLEELSIDDCAVTKTGFAYIRKCPKLRVLTLRKLDFSNAAMAVIGDLRGLRRLDVLEMAIDDRAIPLLAELNNLESLHLTLTAVTGASFKDFSPEAKQRLLELNFHGSPVWTAGLREICRLPALQYLYMAKAEIDDESMAILRGHDKLASIDLAGTKISDAALGTLASMPNLFRLDLSRTRMTDAGISQLQLSRASSYWSSRKAKSAKMHFANCAPNIPAAKSSFPSPLWTSEHACHVLVRVDMLSLSLPEHVDDDDDMPPAVNCVILCTRCRCTRCKTNPNPSCSIATFRCTLDKPNWAASPRLARIIRLWNCTGEPTPMRRLSMMSRSTPPY